MVLFKKFRNEDSFKFFHDFLEFLKPEKKDYKAAFTPYRHILQMVKKVMDSDSRSYHNGAFRRMVFKTVDFETHLQPVHFENESLTGTF